MIQFIPANFDIERHITTYPPTEIESFSKDNLLYMLSFIVSVPSNYKDYRYRSGFVPLNGNKLKNAIGNDYRLYLNYLTRTGLLEENRQYIVGTTARRFRLAKEYRGGFKEVFCSQRQIRRIVLRDTRHVQKLFIQEEYKPYEHLFKWLESDKLQIDLPASKDFLNNLMLKGVRLYSDSREKVQARQTEVNRLNREQNGKKAKLTRRERKIHKYFSTLHAAHRLANFKFKSSFKIDNKAGRLHTPLTGLKKELRNFLVYDGKRLVEIDIKNSQPFFSLALLNEAFWEHGLDNAKKMDLRQISISGTCVLYVIENTTRCKGLIGTCESVIDNKINTTYLKLFNKGKLTHDIYEHIHKRPYLIMIQKRVGDIDKGELTRYRDMVTDGTLYEVLLQRYVEKTGSGDMSRDKMKKVMFTILFSENEKEGIQKETIKQFKTRQKRELAKGLFRDLFPTIYRVFEYIKEDNNAVLACLLQTIEAHVMLDRVCGRIRQERPELPLYTVHDSILTTEGDEWYVKQIMEEEFRRSVGAVPGLSVKLLYPENTIMKVSIAA